MAEQPEDFSKTTMWKKSLEREKARSNSWLGKTTLVILTIAGALVVGTFVYLAFR